MDQKLGYLTIFSIFFIPLFFMMASSKQCEVKLLKSGRALTNHIFKTVAVRTPLDCHFQCQNDIKCKSYNFMITGDICELNNSTKEARPHYFLPDDTRLYMRIRPAEGNISNFTSLICSNESAKKEFVQALFLSFFTFLERNRLLQFRSVELYFFILLIICKRFRRVVRGSYAFCYNTNKLSRW